jgi:hypothetical protein
VPLGHKISTDYFSCSGGTGTDMIKSVPQTYYAKLVFLHPVGSSGHIVHSVASGARNVNTLMFKLGWDRYGCDKKCAGTHYAKIVFWHPVGSGARNIDALFLRIGWARYRYDKKACLDTLRRTCVFASGGICGSYSTFRCVRGMKR